MCEGVDAGTSFATSARSKPLPESLWERVVSAFALALALELVLDWGRGWGRGSSLERWGSSRTIVAAT